jgi:anaerobic dimethyl sulfoxide reductase subunit A
MLVAHKKGDVIVRLSTDDGRYQENGAFGKDTERGTAVARLPARPLLPLAPVFAGAPALSDDARRRARRGKFKRVTWDEALDHIAKKMVELKSKYGPTAILDQAYAGTSYGVLHKSDQIEGLLARFLGMFGCRTNSWSVPSYQGTTFSSRMTFGTIEDGNEDDAFADTKLMIMWGWNPAYTFHGGNTFYYMRLAKQRGCKFVVVDPQYTDSAAAYDAWWIPIRPNTDAAMLAGMAHYIFANNLQDQKFIDKFVQGMDAGTMPDWAKGQESFKDYILGTTTACQDARVGREDLRRAGGGHQEAGRHVRPHQAGGAQGLLGAGPQRLRRAVQPHGGGAAGDDRQHRHPRRLRRRRRQGLARRSVAYPYDENANIWWASIKSDRWAHCVLNYPNVKREEIGCWPRDDALDGKIPNIKGIFWHGSDWFNQLTNINKEIEAIKKLELVVCMDSTITPSGLWADVLLPIATHFERHDVALPWYKGHYYIHRPKVIEPMGESKTDFQVFTELAYRGSRRSIRRSRTSASATTRAPTRLLPQPDAVDEAYLVAWWKKGAGPPGRHHELGGVQARGVYKFKFDKPHVAFRDQIEKGEPFETPLGQDRDLLDHAGQVTDWTKTQYGYPIPAIPKWIEPFEWLNTREGEGVSLPPDHAASALAHPFDLHNIPWLRETYQQEVTLNASDAKRWASSPATSSRSGTTAARSSCRPMSPSAACRAWRCCSRAPGWTSTRRASTAPAIRIS